MTDNPPPRPLRPGDRIRSRIRRAGILPISPGDPGTVRTAGLRNYTQPYVSVTLTLPAGVVYTSFAPDDIEPDTP